MNEQDRQFIEQTVEIAISRHREAMRHEIKNELNAHRDAIETAVENKVMRLSGKGLLWLGGIGLTSGAIGSMIKSWLLTELRK